MNPERQALRALSLAMEDSVEIREGLKKRIRKYKETLSAQKDTINSLRASVGDVREELAVAGLDDWGEDELRAGVRALAVERDRLVVECKAMKALAGFHRKRDEERTRSLAAADQRLFGDEAKHPTDQDRIDAIDALRGRSEDDEGEGSYRSPDPSPNDAG